jgi:methyltransferase
MFSAATLAIGALIAVYLTMLGEWGLSRANERQLRAQGAVEPAGDVHRTMAWAYPLSFLAIGIEGALSGPPSDASLLAGATVFFAAKGLKFWAIASLGTRWTFRVLVPPGSPLVTRGPYLWLRHPN